MNDQINKLPIFATDLCLDTGIQQDPGCWPEDSSCSRAGCVDGYQKSKAMASALLNISADAMYYSNKPPELAARDLLAQPPLMWYHQYTAGMSHRSAANISYWCPSRQQNTQPLLTQSGRGIPNSSCVSPALVPLCTTHGLHTARWRTSNARNICCPALFPWPLHLRHNSRHGLCLPTFRAIDQQQSLINIHKKTPKSLDMLHPATLWWHNKSISVSPYYSLQGGIAST